MKRILLAGVLLAFMSGEAGAVSTYSPRLRFEQQAAGDNLNTWGPKINAALLRLEEGISGRQALTVSGSVTLTTANGTTDQAREMFLDCTGTGGTITIPAVEKLYVVRNSTSGTITVTTGSGATATVNTGEVKLVVSDATNVYPEFLAGNYLPLSGGTITGALAVTGNSTLPNIINNTMYSGSTGGGISIGGGSTYNNGGEIQLFGSTASGASGVIIFSTGTGTTNSQVGSFAANGTFSVTNNATIGGTLGVTGNISANNGMTIANGLTVSALGINVAGTSNFSNGVTFQGTTGFNALGTFNSGLTVSSGTTTVQALTASSFSGAGTGLTGTAASLSIGGNAATATTSTNQSGGTLNATSGTVSGALSAGSFGGTALASAAQTLTGSSTTQAMTPGGFAANSSISANGYYKLPGGLVIAWGSVSTGGGGTTTATFPYTFTTVYNVQATEVGTGGGAASGPAIYNVSTTGCQFVVNPGASVASVYYVVIGN